MTAADFVDLLLIASGAALFLWLMQINRRVNSLMARSEVLMRAIADFDVRLENIETEIRARR